MRWRVRRRSPGYRDRQACTRRREPARTGTRRSRRSGFRYTASLFRARQAQRRVGERLVPTDRTTVPDGVLIAWDAAAIGNADRQQARPRAPRAARRNRTPIHLWVQHGANSPFKRGRTCNGRRRQPGASVHAERPRQIDQMRRVRGAADPEVEDDVVAGVFAFAAQPRARDPEQRIEPVDRARHFGDELNQPVAADQVRHLVRERPAGSDPPARSRHRPAAGSPARSRPTSPAAPDAW